MDKSILWLEDDIVMQEPYVDGLERENYVVDLISKVSEAEYALQTKRYDLLILDCMIPLSADELVPYPPEETKDGHQTGLAFYRRNKDKLEKDGTKVLALTVRLDQEIQDAFVDAGLPQGSFTTKYSLRTLPDFLNRVNTLVHG